MKPYEPRTLPLAGLDYKLLCSLVGMANAELARYDDWNGWIEFFLKAVAVQAEINSAKVKFIMGLFMVMKRLIQDITHSQYAVQLLDAVFDRPIIFSTTDFLKRTRIHKPTGMGLLRQLKTADILLELRPGSGRREAVLCFPELLNITEGRKIL